MVVNWLALNFIRGVYMQVSSTSQAWIKHNTFLHRLWSSFSPIRFNNGSIANLPDSSSSSLGLDCPTPDECVEIWTNTSASWKDSLTVPAYLTEAQFLVTVPLARNGGMTIWVLVDKSLPPDERQILCSCESFRKHSLTSDAKGNVEDSIVHGIASVFCPPEYRRRGYGTRHMREVAKVLRTWQSEHNRCVGSILYSDIGKTYYVKLGWIPNTSNSHLVFLPVEMEWPPDARQVVEENLEELCRRDEQMIRAAMAEPNQEVKMRVTILPDLDHMLWHIGKEDFATQRIFGKRPRAKGAIAGRPGMEAWAIWAHRYYRHPDKGAVDNVLYILRLVLEGDGTANRPPSTNISGLSEAGSAEQAAAIRAVLLAAQVEAAHWRLDHVELWEPSSLVRTLVAQSELDCKEVEREETGIASCLWFGDTEENPTWINNEYYAWC